MRPLHNAALAGFALNCAAVLLLFFGMNAMDFSMHPEEVQEVIAYYASSPAFYSLYGLCLSLQAAGLWLLHRKLLRSGLILALAAGVIMIPLSLPYILGCLGSAYSGRFASLPPAPRTIEGACRMFRPAFPKAIWALFAVSAALSLPLLSAGGFSFLSRLLFSASCVLLHLAIRKSSLSPLLLYDSFFTVFPHFLATRVAVPFDQVRSATLEDNGDLSLKIRTNSGEEVTLSWPLAGVSPKDRDDALRSLGSALQAHGAALL
ncbi:MAG: hypothetical protein LBO77_08190 [Desulfovibrio sp.]|jgi:hypothetical protein|nr:hypothetical protein [Desulfovibrio sp.]